jgi:hypothetical protein
MYRKFLQLRSRRRKQKAIIYKLMKIMMNLLKIDQAMGREGYMTIMI